MHSRIFGIVTKDYFNERQKQDGEPLVVKSDMIEERPYFADYLDDCVDVNEDYKWFVEHLQRRLGALILYDVNDMTFSFKKGYKEKYFRDKFESIVGMLTCESAFDNFTSNKIWKIKDLIDSDFSFYICDEYGSYETLDNFVRDSEENVDYKVIGSIDYHF